MSTTAMIDIVRAGPADLTRVSKALARAFEHDPVLGWVLPDPGRRRARLPSLFAVFAGAYLPLDETYVTSDGAGAALWAPPTRLPVMGDQAEAFGDRIAAALGEYADRGQELDALLEEHHPAKPSFYLQFMGVVPEQQGRGLGSRLLTTVLQRCDQTGTPAYLEATSEANRRLYQRHGFDTVGELTLPQGPPLWPMWRDPVTGPA